MKTLEKKISHIGKIRALNATQIVRVCKLLNWTPEQYCKHQFAEYESFIALACTDIPNAKGLLRYSAYFRGFYNNEWITRNETNFLPNADDLTTELIVLTYKRGVIDGVGYYEPIELGSDSLVEEYLTIHSAGALLCDGDFTCKFNHMLDQILPYV